MVDASASRPKSDSAQPKGGLDVIFQRWVEWLDTRRP